MGMLLARRLFTVDEYHRMADAGILGPDDRVELLHGEIVPMTPIGVPHAACVKRLTQLFVPLAAQRLATIAVQDPLVLAPHEEPQPDIALLSYRADGYAREHPGPRDTLLVVEVADTSLARDREKLPVYASVGIPEVWIVNLTADSLEVHRDPAPAGYQRIQRMARGAAVRPARFPDLYLATDDILGPVLLAGPS